MFACEFCGKLLRSGLAIEVMLLGRREMHTFCDRECFLAWDSGLARKFMYPLPWLTQ